MPRTPGIRYYHSRFGYFTQINGTKIRLASGPKDEPSGPTYKKASEEYGRVVNAEKRSQSRDGMPCSTAIVSYFHALETSGRTTTLAICHQLLRPAISSFGRVPVNTLRPFHVTNWLSGHKTWNANTRRKAISLLITALNWCKEQNFLTTNPIAGMKKPEAISRGRECLIPPALQELLISSAVAHLARVFRVLQLTGARPGEIMNAQCKHYFRQKGMIVLPWNPPPGEWRWKNGAKTKRDRKIILPPIAQAIVEEEVAKHSPGPIFRNRRGGIIKGKSGLNWYWRKLVEKKPIQDWCKENSFDSKKLVPYGFRHSYITSMLLAGTPIKILADLCGTSVQEIERTYGHGHDEDDTMRRLALRFHQSAFTPSVLPTVTPGSAGQPSPSPADSTT